MNRQQRIARLEQQIRSNDGADFVELVLDASVVQHHLYMSLSAFDEPELLYVALQFASYHGRSVTVIPSIEHHPELMDHSFHA